MRIWVFVFCLCAIALPGAEFKFKDRIGRAKVGDYVVTEAGKMITLLSIRSISSSTLLLEEISAPLQNLNKRPDSWPEWVKAKAPGHSSWSMVEIDLQTGQLIECYSFSRSGWLQLSQKESLLATLLNLPMQPIPEADLRKIGPPPMEGEPDVRKVWNPPLIFEGKKVGAAHFDAYQTVWPADGSELSGQNVQIYFDREKLLPLPAWIQVETAHATAALRTIDAGSNLPVVYRTIPRRVPEFVGTPLKTENSLKLCLKSQKYYKQFEAIFPITHSVLSEGGMENRRNRSGGIGDRAGGKPLVYLASRPYRPQRSLY